MMRKLLIILLVFIPFISPAQDRPEDNLLFNCFKNTAAAKVEGNSVTVAFIKAAIGTFGVNNVFRSLNKEEAEHRYNIMLRNGNIILLGFDELETATRLSGFKGNSTDLLSEDIRKYAVLCYAVMGKKLQSGTSNYTFATALADLNDGYKIEDIAALLGIGLKPIKPFGPKDLEHYNHIIVKNFYYTAYSSAGFYDELTTPGYSPVDDLRKNHFGMPCAIKRCSITAAYRVDEL